MSGVPIRSGAGGLRRKSCTAQAPALKIEDTMKLSIEAELVYNFVGDTQVIANLEASRTSDQIILSESLDICSRRPNFFPIPRLTEIGVFGLPFPAT
jgi:hypothetical protein